MTRGSWPQRRQTWSFTSICTELASDQQNHRIWILSKLVNIVLIPPPPYMYVLVFSCWAELTSCLLTSDLMVSGNLSLPWITSLGYYETPRDGISMAHSRQAKYFKYKRNTLIKTYWIIMNFSFTDCSQLPEAQWTSTLHSCVCS